MKNMRYCWGLMAAVLVALLSSCGSPKAYTYLQDVELMKRYATEQNADIKVEAGDRLNIHVGSAFPELAAPLNGGGYPKVGATGGASGSANGEAQTEMKSYGYMVDPDGTINFPILGRVPVAGMTPQQVARSLERRIVDSKSLTDPRVSVEITNFKVYLLGAIAGQGGDGTTFSNNNYNNNQGTAFTRLPGVQGGMLKVYDKNQLNLLEAIAMVGDLPQKARVDHVNVLRKGEDGAFVTYRVNLKSADLFYSPAFYLKQNDIVYVEYRYRRTQSLDRAMQISGYFFSTVASVVALVALIKK